MACEAPSGVGGGHTVVLTVDGVRSPPLANRSVSYAAPVVQGLHLHGALNESTGSSGTGNGSVGVRVVVPTAGGVRVTVTGVNFGPSALSDRALGSVLYTPVDLARLLTGTAFTAQDCRVTVDHTEIECWMGPGVGGRIQWTVAVAGLQSVNPRTAYKMPSISSMSLAEAPGPPGTASDLGDLASMRTTGGQLLLLNGTSFGPRSPSLSIALMGRQTGVGAAQQLPDLYTSNCAVTGEGHVEAVCMTPPGVGRGYVWTLVVAGLASRPSSQVTAYAPPSVTSLTISSVTPLVEDPGAVPTSGGATVTVSGENFGADPALVQVLWGGVPVGVVLLAVAHTTLTFTSPPGQGASVGVVVVVGGQETGVLAGSGAPLSVRYARPRVTRVYLDRSGGGGTMSCSREGSDGRPLSGSGGAPSAVVVLEGTNFAGNASANAVTIRGATCAVLQSTFTRIYCVTEVCSGVVLVSAAGMQTDAGPFSYLTLVSPPTIVWVAPLTGPTSGGTLVTLQGTQLACDAVIEFAEWTAGGVLTGVRSVCSTAPPHLVCNATLVQCVSPAATALGHYFDIRVSVGGVPATYARYWMYEPPAVHTVTPATLMPQPLTTRVVLMGSNFGSVRGTVTVGGHSWECPQWANNQVSCVPAPGVQAHVAVVVTTAAGLVSIPSQAAAATVTYQAPSIDLVRLVTASGDNPPPGDPVQDVSTRGGERLEVVGWAFVAPLPMSVWLVRGELPAPPWAAVPRRVLPCGLVPEAAGQGNTSSVPSVLRCALPPGSGVDWRVVVVNHGDATAASVSLPSLATVRYRAPRVWTVGPVAQGLGRPTVGGWLLVVNGSDFSSEDAVVTVGGLPCPIAGNHSHELIVCTTPPWRINADSNVVVTVDGQASYPVPVAYDPPRVLSVLPNVVVAVLGARSRLTLRGVNFGVKYSRDAPGNHLVSVGSAECVDVVWTGDDALSCMPVGELVVGDHPVSLTVANHTATLANAVSAQCPPDTFGGPGERCSTCPEGAICAGFGAEPVSQEGRYPLSRTLFAACVPSSACVGGASECDGWRRRLRQELPWPAMCRMPLWLLPPQLSLRHVPKHRLAPVFFVLRRDHGRSGRCGVP